jgi:RND family efflux transporter MFP subunit
MKTHTFFPIASLVLSTLVLATSCSGDHTDEPIKKDAPVKVTVALPGKQVNDKITVSGQIESGQTAVISTRVMGFVTSVNVDVGEQVHPGKLLATISNADLEAKKGQVQALVAEAEAALSDAQKDYERFSELSKNESASKKEFENATLHYHALQAKAESARQMLKEVDAMLSYTRLTSPIAGVVVQKNLDAGSMASPGVPILVLEKKGSFQVSASVSEQDIAFVKDGAPAEIVVKATGKRMVGKVSEVSPSGSLSGGQYQLKVTIPDKENSGLFSGMYVSLSIQSSQLPVESTGGVVVPASSIVYTDQLAGIYTVSGNQTALLRWVKLGKPHGQEVEVLSGLRSDEKFILESEGKLYNGVPVSIQ